MENQSNTVKYKEFTLISLPVELAENKGWISKIIIRVEKGNDIKDISLESKVIFLNKEEAIKYGFGIAQKYIDDGQANDLLS